jgi:hypothetical protein
MVLVVEEGRKGFQRRRWTGPKRKVFYIMRRREEIKDPSVKWEQNAGKVRTQRKIRTTGKIQEPRGMVRRTLLEEERKEKKKARRRKRSLRKEKTRGLFWRRKSGREERWGSVPEEQKGWMGSRREERWGSVVPEEEKGWMGSRREERW